MNTDPSSGSLPKLTPISKEGSEGATHKTQFVGFVGKPAVKKLAFPAVFWADSLVEMVKDDT